MYENDPLLPQSHKQILNLTFYGTKHLLVEYNSLFTVTQIRKRFQLKIELSIRIITNKMAFR